MNIIYSPITYFAIGISSILLYYKYSFKDSKKLETQVSEWMINNLSNKIIRWKQKNSNINENYTQFIIDTFPENIKVKNGHVIWMDPRIEGPNWKGLFYKINSFDKLHIQSSPPGV